MSEVKIKSASIKDGLFLTGEYSKKLSGDDSEKIKFDRTTPVHSDLSIAFNKLHKHLALICEEIIPVKKIKDFDKWDDEGLYVKDEKEPELPLDAEPKPKVNKFHVIGFTIRGNDENEGCEIGGYKIGKYGTVDLTTPKTKWNDKKYPHASELSSDIQACIYEVEEYLFNDKRAPEQQLSFGFEGAAENETYSEEAL